MNDLPPPSFNRLIADTTGDQQDDAWVDVSSIERGMAHLTIERIADQTGGIIPIILDSGATSHMTPLRATLTNFRLRGGKVLMGGKNSYISIQGIGDMGILSNVLHVPELKFALISLSKLDQDGCDITIRNSEIIVFNAQKVVVLEATLQQNLYILKPTYLYSLYGGNRVFSDIQWHLYLHSVQAPEEPTIISPNNASSATVSPASNTALINIFHDSTIAALHRKWGHLNLSRIKRAIAEKMVTGANINTKDLNNTVELPTCLPCLQGKMKAGKTPPTTSHDWAALEKIGVDYKGNFPVKSVHGYRGFFLFSDYHSHFVYAWLAKSKADALDAIRSVVTNVLLPHRKVCRVLQSDSDDIFTNSDVTDWLTTNGIRQQLSAPYSHFQNGQIERDMQTVMDTARTLMASSNVPPSYCEFAIKHACFLINRSPAARGKRTPLETISGQVPDVSLFVPFFCPGVFHCTLEERKSRAWAYKAEPCRFLGFDERCKDTYIVLCIRTRAILSRKDCVFDEELSLHNLLDDVQYDPFEDESDLPDSRTVDIDMDHTNTNIRDMPHQLNSTATTHDLNCNDDATNRDHELLTDEELYLITDLLLNPVISSLDATTADSTIVEFPFRGTSDNLAAHTNLTSWYHDLVERILLTKTPDLSLPPQPKTLQEALSGPWSTQWQTAIDNELAQLADRQVLIPAPPTYKGRALKSKIILRVTYDNNYALKFKARLVVCGYSQRPGIDFHETFSPTTSTQTVLMLLHCAGALGLHLTGFDVTAAFLEGTNDVPLFCKLPHDLNPSSKDRQPQIFQIVKSLYGEKQAPKIWNDHLHSILEQIGLHRSPIDPCLYEGSITSKNNRIRLFLCVHVDDGLILTDSPISANHFLAQLSKHLRKITTFDPLKKYIGLEIESFKSRHIPPGAQYHPWEIHQQSYIRAQFCSQHTSSPPRVPMSPTIHLPLEIPDPTNESLLPLIGTLRYLADKSRPDLLVVASELSSGSGHTHPSKQHIKTAFQCVQYLQHTSDLKLRLGGDPSLKLFGFCDASHISTGDSKSRLGGCLFLGLNSGAFHSFSKKDTTVSHSSTEAEIKALDLLIKQILIVRDNLKFMGIEQQEPTPIFMDNASAIQLCTTLKSTHKTKHINVRINFIRQVINDRHIRIHFVSTALNVADILTKALGPDLFLPHRAHLLGGFTKDEFDSLTRQRQIDAHSPTAAIATTDSSVTTSSTVTGGC